MAKLFDSKLNSLGRLLPEGLLVDAAWLTAQGYSTSLRTQYVAAGWLSRLARRVYWRGRGTLTWQQAVISLQTLLGQRLIVGGRSALQLQGYAHFLGQANEIFLYGPHRPPNWVHELPLREGFLYRNSEPLLPTVAFPHILDRNTAGYPADLVALPYGQWEWPLVVSRPERAIFEVLNELPARETFDQVDALVEGLVNLRPRLLTTLLGQCRSVKAKRLFFYFADRHKHAWLKRIDPGTVDLGKGKRSLVRGGVLDPTYQITVPREFHAVS